MDPRHKLYKELDKLTVDPDKDTIMSDDLNTGPATSGVTIESLKQKLAEGLGATYVEIEDLSGKFSYVARESDSLYCKRRFGG
jgi:hypothetical protein